MNKKALLAAGGTLLLVVGGVLLAMQIHEYWNKKKVAVPTSAPLTSGTQSQSSAGNIPSAATA